MTASSLQVIGAGFGRTGTVSLQAALNKLGYKTHHCANLYGDETQDPGVWLRAFDHPDTHNDEWDKVYGDYTAAVDFPTAVFYKELSEKYPEAKFILTVRSPESWYESTQKTVFQAINLPMKGHHKKVRDILKRITLDGVMDEEGMPRAHDKEYMCRLFMDHNERVKQTIPADRVLIMNLGDGWEPLCHFLGKPIPDEPYPHMNKRDTFYEKVAFLNLC
ncbi:P-loop containing nucleoside triphosphate hydrolase protein [Halteromyces radiatus]|uniref:P-loop containing nucleoside triphosphate hydrolase protein n=1 Tax=Halteromyces radiatus TaxID=101107 RepID=UPI0022201D1D|nr:P-loop containing nucleoside triphosphate hydrolase protein [Halteromyces radiatus]KAI8098788.1 P-loop containing nucleoside triphosphate hydrolase protein [Halteromyces radiatus]